MRKIDVFTHIYPAGFFEKLMRLAPDFKDVGKRSRGVPMLVDLEERFRVMDRFEGYQQILSLPTPPLEVMATPAQAHDLARAANDGMAELVARHPQRFPGFVASLPYNDPDAAMREAGPARLGFSFARDVPKAAGAVRELVATGALGLERGLRVLDVGAGMGATTWGVARALSAASRTGPIEATWVDSDAVALEVGMAIVRARQAQEGKGGIDLRVHTSTRPVGRSITSSARLARPSQTFRTTVVPSSSIHSWEPVSGCARRDRCVFHVPMSKSKSCCPSRGSRCGSTPAETACAQTRSG